MASYGKFDYTGLDFNKIKAEIQRRMAQEVGLENFRESAISKVILDIVAAATDFNNYYIERRAQESYLDTAQLRSSVIANSRMLGYSVRRPIPALAALQMDIQGGAHFTGLQANDTVTIPKWTSFVYNDQTFLTKYAYTYTFTSGDVNNLTSPDTVLSVKYSIGDGVAITQTTTEAEYIDLIQGKFVAGVWDGQQNESFQKHIIEDLEIGKKVSNWFGTEDEGYDEKVLSPNDQYCYISKCETVDDVLEPANNFFIDRRTLSRPDLYQEGVSPRLCVIRTTNDENIEVMFGDAKEGEYGFSEIGVEGDKKIFYKFFITEGGAANRTGLIGKELQLTSEIATNGFDDITPYCTFKFFRNPQGGEDMESKESIAINAPAIFNSLDRLVSRTDYVNFFKTLTTGNGRIVKNSRAWGEQEEVRYNGDMADYRFYNIIFFSILSSLYKQVPGGLVPLEDNELYEAFLEIQEDFNNKNPEVSWFNIYVAQSPGTEKKRVQDFREDNDTHPISLTYEQVEKRSLATCTHLYVTPMVHQVSLEGYVKLKKTSSAYAARRNINNRLYSFLDLNNDFNSEVLLSNLIGIIEEDPDVVNVPNIKFQPILKDQYFKVEGVTTAEIFSDIPTLNLVKDQMKEILTGSGFEDNVTNMNYLVFALVYAFGPLSSDTTTITQRKIYDAFKTMLTPTPVGFWRPEMVGWEKTPEFSTLVSAIISDFYQYVGNNIIDEFGNISKYSIGSEITQVRINLVYGY